MTKTTAKTTKAAAAEIVEQLTPYDNAVTFVINQGYASCHEMMQEFGITFAEAVQWIDRMAEERLVESESADGRPRLTLLEDK